MKCDKHGLEKIVKKRFEYWLYLILNGLGFFDKIFTNDDIKLTLVKKQFQKMPCYLWLYGFWSNMIKDKKNPQNSSYILNKI